MKKGLILVLVLVLALSLFSGAFAAELEVEIENSGVEAVTSPNLDDGGFTTLSSTPPRIIDW